VYFNGLLTFILITFLFWSYFWTLLLIELDWRFIIIPDHWRNLFYSLNMVNFLSYISFSFRFYLASHVLSDVQYLFSCIVEYSENRVAVYAGNRVYSISEVVERLLFYILVCFFVSWSSFFDNISIYFDCFIYLILIGKEFILYTTILVADDSYLWCLACKE
jgi:hypothetical protein